MPKLILQPKDSALCGQCCIAMATGVSLKRVIKFTGQHPDGMSTSEVKAALRHFGMQCAERMRPVKFHLGPVQMRRAMLHTTQRIVPSTHHWSLLWDGGIFEPGGPYTALYFPTTIVGYLEIYQ